MAELTTAETRAVGLFLAMEEHEAGCLACAQAGTAMRAALGREDATEAMRLAQQYCPAMSRMAESFEAACREAFADRQRTVGRG